ncbi:MAG: bile acid:sodium symporter family protein [Woeseiaceae bacterium]
MNLDVIFTTTIVIFTVSNIGALGLETNLREALKHLYNFRAIGLVLLWGWVVGPALALLLVEILPLAEAHAAGLLLISLAPTAPFFPLMVRRARGDMSFAASFMMLTTVGVVLFLPLLAPWLIEGLAVDSWDLARPLLIMVFLPLVIGVAIREFARSAAEKLLPIVQKIGMLFLLIGLVLTLVLFGREMLGLIGSFAPGAQVLFFVAITALSYTIHFGLTQPQRSAMALGMCTRNIAAVFAAFFGIENPPEGLFVMIALVVPLAAIIALIAAGLFVRDASVVAEQGDNV